MKYVFILISLIHVGCVTYFDNKPLAPLSEKEKGILFVKDHIPDDSLNCKFLGSIKYTSEDDQVYACATHERQQRVFIRKADEMNANLIVANFEKDSAGIHKISGSISCENKAKVFACPDKSIELLKKYE